jgi:hypothetical protein
MPLQIAVALGSCLLLVSISVVFFRQGRASTLRTRIAASAHASLVAAVLPYGLLIDATTTGNAPAFLQLPIALLLLLAVTSMVYSIWVLRDKPLLHLAHLITIVLGVPLTFLGSVAIVGWT